MNNFAVRVGAKNFHGEAEQQMLTYLQKHIAFCFVITPVVNNKIRNERDKKVD